MELDRPRPMFHNLTEEETEQATTSFGLDIFQDEEEQERERKRADREKQKQKKKEKNKKKNQKKKEKRARTGLTPSPTRKRSESEDETEEQAEEDEETQEEAEESEATEQAAESPLTPLHSKPISPYNLSQMSQGSVIKRLQVSPNFQKFMEEKKKERHTRKRKVIND